MRRKKLITAIVDSRSITRAKQEVYTVFMMAAIAIAIVGCMR